MNLLKHAANGWDPSSVAGQYRARRFSLFLEVLKPFTPPVRILDVGGHDNYWSAMNRSQMPPFQLTLLNTHPMSSRLPNVTCVMGDARRMPQFDNDQFDVVFSNSTIEHVGTLRDQRSMAEEVMRIGKTYFVQTPNRRFPMEPHFLLPYIQYAPQWFRAMLHQRLNLGWWQKDDCYFRALEEVESIRLLTGKEMTYLFPSARIYKERMLGWIKSFIAIGPSS